MDLSKRLMHIRKQMGLSQEQFGALFDVSRQAVSKWELGQSKPDIDVLMQISKQLQISLDDLVYEDASLPVKDSGFERLLTYKRNMTFGLILLCLGLFGLLFIYFDFRIVMKQFYLMQALVLHPLWIILIYLSWILIACAFRCFLTSIKKSVLTVFARFSYLAFSVISLVYSAYGMLYSFDTIQLLVNDSAQKSAKTALYIFIFFSLISLLSIVVLIYIYRKANRKDVTH